MKHSLILSSLILFSIGLPNTNVIAEQPDANTLADLQSGLESLQQKVTELQSNPDLQNRDRRQEVADVAVFAKAVEWMLRHNEFPKKGYAKSAARVIELGQQRVAELTAGKPTWTLRQGVSIRGYTSTVDGSVQPYALSLPAGVDSESGDRWPLYVKLHGRANDMNEVDFIHRHEGKPLAEDQTWIQLDVYGRGNNAYRWAGETDVFEAIVDVRRRFRIDDNRVTLHGFSMGGAGSWHLGLHHPATWSSVGPGAGFVDFYKYQKQTEQRPPWQHANLGIYDAIDYSLNAFNVPVCTYGGENDPQAEAGRSVVAAAKERNVGIKSLIGAGMGHKFHPDSLKEFMAFHKEKSAAGRPRILGRPHIRFTTKTLKYNDCDWLTIEEMELVYEPATVDAKVNDRGNVDITTSNIAVLSLSRDAGTFAIIDGESLPCYDAAESLLPNVIYEKTSRGWVVQTYDESRAFEDNPSKHKRHNLQGPIDDAFMGRFTCVTGTGNASNGNHQAWSAWTLKRFDSEFDKWMRAKVPVVRDADVDDEMIEGSHLILFGDPSSNSVLKKVLPELPIEWTDETITVNGQSYSTADHAVSLIFPNPLNPSKYIVINSGHTFHEADFKNSNSWLFPRLGDIAVQKFTKQDDGSFDEQTVWAANFNSGWRLPNPTEP